MEKVKKIYKKNKKLVYSGIISFICTCIRFAIYFFILWLTAGKYLLANLISYIISFAILFYCNQRLFESKPEKKKEKMKQLITFLLFRVVGFIIDSALLVLFIEVIKLTNIIARISSALITFVYNYTVNRLFVFKDRNKINSNSIK